MKDEGQVLRIAVDAMGGDSGVGVVVAGAVDFLRHSGGGVEVILVGDEEKIRRELKHHGDLPVVPSIEHASEEIQMEEKAVFATRRKQDSSIGRGLHLQKEGKADAFVSAGNTGAVVASALLILGRLRSVRRPALATYVPNEKNGFVLIDVGATKECRSTDLARFALMGSIFAERIMGRENPRVGILNIGEEETKGNDLTRAAHTLLRESGLNFVGNVESGGMFRGEVDVAVCDGFVGNVILKFAEGMMEMMLRFFREEVSGHLRAKLGALLLKPSLLHIKEQLSYEEYGGAPLLGVDGICIICHGRSSSLAIANAIRLASRYVEYDINREIGKRLEDADEVTVE